MYLSKDYNSVAAIEPGSPGLFFTHNRFWLTNVNPTAKNLEDAGRPRPDWERVNRVLTCLNNDNWLFIGQYEVSFCRALSLSEWKNLSHKEGRRLTVAEVDNAMINAKKIKNKRPCVQRRDFQLRLATKSSMWTPKDKTDTGPMKKKGKKDSTKPEKNRENIIRKSRTRKRKRIDDESSNSNYLDYTLNGQFGKDSRSLGLESNYQVRQ
ncbi:hypothetical protein DFH05DRAFT_1555024 [Lentinula detonsa]|uniref:DUF6697 domain-containing protein n=1 Tax=Lentinula detonsa TaxID=2804962 RepID=A0A9W8U285_9AGAR|nr:hypothetical protein DFH05DRAFT_1555024 [Lentinula detonsa]